MDDGPIIERMKFSNSLLLDHESAELITSAPEGIWPPGDVRFKDFEAYTVERIFDGLLVAFERDSDTVGVETTFHVTFDRGPLDHVNQPIFLDFDRDGSILMEVFARKGIPYSESECESILTGVFSSIGASLDRINYRHDEFGGAWEFDVRLNDPSITLKELLACRRRATHRIAIAEGDERGGRDTVGLVLHLLRSGKIDQIIGVFESESVEFKKLIDLGSEAAKIKLAQHVAKFANADSFALLVIGVRTDKVDGQDVATKVTPVLAIDNHPARYREIVDSRVYPPVRGLAIEHINVTDDHVIVVIHIPAQRESEKPFLVHGAIVEGNAEGAFFSIVRRRGDGALPVAAREVHALLSAGYQLLRSDPRDHNPIQ